MIMMMIIMMFPVLLLLQVSIASASVFNLRSLISGIARNDPAHFLSYGCNCGLGNSGNGLTVDCIDECCRLHDTCYAKFASSCSENAYFANYQYEEDTFKCVLVQAACLFTLCDCDYNLATCLNKTAHVYSEECRNVMTQPICGNGNGSLIIEYSEPTRTCNGENLKNVTSVCARQTSDDITQSAERTTEDASSAPSSAASTTPHLLASQRFKLQTMQGCLFVMTFAYLFILLVKLVR